MMIALTHNNKDKAEIAMDDQSALEHGQAKQQVGALNEHSLTIGMDSFADCISAQHGGSVSRKRRKKEREQAEQISYEQQQQIDLQNQISQWKRIMLLVVAITVHNIPEGLAVGVAFGAIGSTKSATFEAARNLAIGIGIQNFPEGLAVSLPLHAAGEFFVGYLFITNFESFCY
jgi:zinc transporter 11